MTQKILYGSTMGELVRLGNKHLRGSWQRVVPRSMGAATTHRAAQSSMECGTKDGKVFSSVFWCVVEKDAEEAARENNDNQG